MIKGYFQQLEQQIHQSSVVNHSAVTYEQRSIHIGFVKGILYLLNGTSLHFREYVDMQEQQVRLKYSYQWQDSDGSLIFRYDNAPHYPDLPEFPHHKHDGREENVSPTSPPDLSSVLGEIQQKLAI